MNLLLKEDKKYVLNGKTCTFVPGKDTSVFFTNPKATFNFEDGTTISCIYTLLTGTYAWTGGSISNGTLSYLGSSWVLKDYVGS